jgi:hypothetical protein
MLIDRRDMILTTSIQRRDFLKLSTSSLIGGRAFLLSSPRADAAAVLPIDRLISQFEAGDGQVYTRNSQADYNRLMTFYNKRFECITPEVLIYCRTAKSVAKAVQWCVRYGLEFSLRSGGHCYEGLSRSLSIIIDLRGLNAIEFNPINHVLRVGSGVALKDIYRTVAPAGQAIPRRNLPHGRHRRSCDSRGHRFFRQTIWTRDGQIDIGGTCNSRWSDHCCQRAAAP